MTTLTVNIDNKKSEKAIKAVLDALGLDYSLDQNSGITKRALNKDEQRAYKNLKSSISQIKMHQEGEIDLRDAQQLLDEL